MEWLTDIANVKLLVDIHSLINNFIKDPIGFKIDHFRSFELIFCKYFFIVVYYSVYSLIRESWPASGSFFKVLLYDFNVYDDD